MALEASFSELIQKVRAARDALHELSVCFNFKPTKGASYLVDQFGDILVELLAASDEALVSAHEALRTIGPPTDLDAARRALARCQALVQRVELGFSTELASYQRIVELRGFARRRRGEWLGWIAGLRADLDKCDAPLRRAREALFSCWQEIAERVGTTCVTLQATNIGQMAPIPASRQPVGEPD
jgi:hypothetical protein